MESFNIEYWFLSYLFILHSWGNNHFQTKKLVSSVTALGPRCNSINKLYVMGSLIHDTFIH